MGDIVIVQEYDRPTSIVWKALTDPTLVPLWTSTGRGGRPEGFRFIGKPVPGWDGTVRCEVLASEPERLLRYSWRNKESDRPSHVSYELEPTVDGTRFTYRHTDFRGIEGMVMSRLLARVRRRMLTQGLPPVLAELDDEGHLRPNCRFTSPA
jgi:uncharacterized protein YndB with AHSA1/START domain